jgi:Flp pilus assembly protein TadG
MRLLKNILSSAAHRAERGQSIVIFAISGTAMIALVGLSVDVGMLLLTRADLQKAADAAVTAGAQNLPDSVTASTVARDYVSKNAGSSAAAAVTVKQTYSANDTIVVVAQKRVNYSFLRVLGLAGADVTATATARVGNYVGGNGLLPWGFVSNSTNSCFLGFSNGNPQFKQNQSCKLKSGAPGAGGDFGAISLDGTGASTYRTTIVNGSTKSFVIGDKVYPETGNMTGPTLQGAQDRFAKPAPASCKSNKMEDVLHMTNGVVSIVPGCEYSPRIVLLPVVDQINNPQASTILGFAFMFMEDVKNAGGHTEVTAQFVKFVTAIPGGIYTGASNTGATAVLLTE